MYLHACLQETCRIHQNTSDGLPRIRMSPCAMDHGPWSMASTFRAREAALTLPLLNLQSH